MDLTDLRREMDETDRALLALFARRMALSGAIARVKQEAHLPVLDPRREEGTQRPAADTVPPAILRCCTACWGTMRTPCLKRPPTRWRTF